VGEEQNWSKSKIFKKRENKKDRLDKGIQMETRKGVFQPVLDSRGILAKAKRKSQKLQPKLKKEKTIRIPGIESEGKGRRRGETKA